MTQNVYSNLNNSIQGTPLYNYNGLPLSTQNQVKQTADNNSQNPYTSQIYKYPQNSLYNPTLAIPANGVNINIINPTGYTPAQYSNNFSSTNPVTNTLSQPLPSAPGYSP